MLTFHFDEERNMTIDQCRRSDTTIFTQDELAKSYVMASRDHIKEYLPKGEEVIESYLASRIDKENKRVFSV